MKLNRNTIIIGILCLTVFFLVTSCKEETPSNGVNTELKGGRGKKPKKRPKDHIQVDMVKRTLRFVKRNISITPAQEAQIIDITSEYNFDSLSREEFYFKRLKLRDRIYEEVLNETQRQEIRNK
jgi:hypothetical protein